MAKSNQTITVRTHKDASPEKEDEIAVPTSPVGMSKSYNSSFKHKEQSSDYKHLGSGKQDPPKCSSYGKFPLLERTAGGYNMQDMLRCIQERPMGDRADFS